MFGFYKEPVLSDAQLRRLGEHKYSSSGSTLLDPLMQRFWNWFVTKVPLSIAPNVLTVTGLIVNAVTTLILILCSPDAKHEVCIGIAFVVVDLLSVTLLSHFFHLTHIDLLAMT